MNQLPILKSINSPRDLKAIPAEDLEELCAEIRSYIIQTISQTGGHLASNLGVVELTVAIHRAFDSPNDKLVWDVGHQCYTHKLLTGRRDEFPTIRQENGISGFPKSKESIYDAFLSGHSTNSLSAASGIARAEMIKGTGNRVVAVIGDGAFTGGMAYEALNNAGSLNNLIVILNYNEMSISKTVGSFARYLATVRAKPKYLETKHSVESLLNRTPIVGPGLKRGVKKAKLRLKNMLYNSNFFTDLGFSYLGPVDGHDLHELADAMEWAKKTDKPALIQVYTTKGKGYPRAEKNPGAYHGISKFDVETGNPDISEENSFSAEFGRELKRLGDRDDTICAITAAMKYGTGLQYFASAHRDRFFDVGIAEEHAVTFAAGLASNGMKPVFAVYSTFLQRGYDQIIHDASIEQQHVVFAIDRAGIVGNDGETHQGLFDTAFLSSVPNMTIFAPATYAELKAMLRRSLYEVPGVAALRYPRGQQDDCPAFGDPTADYHLEGEGNTLIISYGRIFFNALRASHQLREQGVPTALCKLNRICPIPQEAVEEMLRFERIFFFEEGIHSGGIAEHLLDQLNQAGYRGLYHISAVDRFVPQASVDSSLKQLGLDANSMAETILQHR